MVGIELTTSPLPRVCSTTELHGPAPEILPNTSQALLIPVVGAGFEPAYVFRRTVLQTVAINHSATPPGVRAGEFYGTSGKWGILAPLPGFRLGTARSKIKGGDGAANRGYHVPAHRHRGQHAALGARARR